MLDFAGTKTIVHRCKNRESEFDQHRLQSAGRRNSIDLQNRIARIASVGIVVSVNRIQDCAAPAFPIGPVLNECGNAALRVEPRRVRRCFPDLLGNGNIRRSGNDPSVPNSCDHFRNTSAEIRVYDKCDRVVHRCSSFLVARIHLSRCRRIDGIRSRLWSVYLACGLSRRLTARGLVQRFNVEPARCQVHFRVAE